MAYHSSLTNYQQLVGNIAIMPIKTKFRGPAHHPFRIDEDDIIDETFAYFKANVFFRTFEIKSEADRILIYITLYITECLKTIQKCVSKQQALSLLYSLALSKFDIPGDPNFPLNAMYSRPETPADSDLLKLYLTQIRQETGVRLCDKLFQNDDDKPNKWWLCFSKRKFMDISLTGH